MNKYDLISGFNAITLYFPYSLLMNIKTIVASAIKSDLRKELKKNNTLKNIHKGERCFIVGNGPSLKKQDLTLLKNEFTMVTNNFILHELINIINPNYYCIVDPNMYNGKFPIERLRLMDEKLDDTKYFFRYRSKKYVKDNGLFGNKEIFYLKNEAYLNDFCNLNMKLEGCIPGTVNVVHTCIMIAAYMGFDDINLIGCDATMFIPKPSHFYEMTGEEKNSNENLDEKLFYTSYMFKSYRILKDYYEKRGIKIINATQGGVLEIFPRVGFDELIKMNK